jgi:hypothetical protein
VVCDTDDGAKLDSNIVGVDGVFWRHCRFSGNCPI